MVYKTILYKVGLKGITLDFVDSEPYKHNTCNDMTGIYKVWGRCQALSCSHTRYFAVVQVIWYTLIFFTLPKQALAIFESLLIFRSVTSLNAACNLCSECNIDKFKIIKVLIRNDRMVCIYLTS